MKKDIEIPDVKDVYIAAVLELDENNNAFWYIHLINGKNEILEGIMITSCGYMFTEKGRETVSSTFRHKMNDMLPKTVLKIEMLDPQVFEIYNEYWVTFFCNNKLMECKFTFEPFTIGKNYLAAVPLLKDKGILAREGMWFFIISDLKELNLNSIQKRKLPKGGDNLEKD